MSPIIVAGQPTWKAMPIANGIERILLLAVYLLHPKEGEDGHMHVRVVFSELAKMVCVKQTIDFPKCTYTRNAALCSWCTARPPSWKHST